jgi:hypothetical protein
MRGPPVANLPVIAEAHQPQARATNHLPVIAQAHKRQVAKLESP